MDDLKKHEQFEMEVLALLSSKNILNKLIFGGGTCLRLCFSLDRYSVDLDFWSKPTFTKKDYKSMRAVLAKNYEVTDAKEKHFTYLIELRSKNYPRKLKLEIRKKPKKTASELNIAFSAHATEQVRLETFTLKQMWQNKVDALVDRGEIRDAFDLEFLIKKIEKPTISDEERSKILKILDSFKARDYKVKLGSLLSSEEREYYATSGFKLLRAHL